MEKQTTTNRINPKIEDDKFSKNQVDRITPVKLSETQFAYDIWLFELHKNKHVLKGIYRDGILSKLISLGYFKRVRENGSYFFIKEIDNTITQIEPYKIKDDAFLYVQEIASDIIFEYSGHDVTVKKGNLRETFLRQSHLIFNSNYLEHLPIHTKRILRDNKTNSYIPFRNKILQVNKTGILIIDYPELEDTCIWEKHIIKRDFELNNNFETCHFNIFLKNVTNHDPERYKSIISTIGYLLHNYQSPKNAQAVIFYDEMITDFENPQGGTGKGLFVQGLKQIRNVVTIDGKKMNLEDRFRWQDIDDQTQIIVIDDPKPSLDFSAFHSCLTTGWSIEKKNQPQFSIKPEDSPKMLISTNSIVKGEGTTNKRRQHIIEFSNYYQKFIINGLEEPIINEHGCLFFDKEDWLEEEWNMFYNLMISGLTLYFQIGLHSYELKNVDQNKLIQSTNNDFNEWSVNQNFELNKQYLTTELYNDFQSIYYGDNKEFQQRKFTNWLKKYALSKNWKLTIKRSNGNSIFSFNSPLVA